MKPIAKRQLEQKKPTWKIHAYFLDACNCDWGCPCQFNAKPTHGNCEGVAGYHVPTNCHPFWFEIIALSIAAIFTQVVFSIDAKDLKNSTIQALNIANITDEILREYAIAYGIEPVIATSGSMGNMMNMSTMDMEDNRIPSASRIANISNYENAQGLAIKVLEIFRDDLKPVELPNTTRSFLTADIRSNSVSGLGYS